MPGFEAASGGRSGSVWSRRRSWSGFGETGLQKRLASTRLQRRHFLEPGHSVPGSAWSPVTPCPDLRRRRAAVRARSGPGVGRGPVSEKPGSRGKRRHHHPAATQIATSAPSRPPCGGTAGRRGRVAFERQQEIAGPLDDLAPAPRPAWPRGRPSSCRRPRQPPDAERPVRRGAARTSTWALPTPGSRSSSASCR